MTDKEFKYHIPVRHDHGEIMEWLVDNNVPVDSRALRLDEERMSCGEFVYICMLDDEQVAVAFKLRFG